MFFTASEEEGKKKLFFFFFWCRLRYSWPVHKRWKDFKVLWFESSLSLCGTLIEPFSGRVDAFYTGLRIFLPWPSFVSVSLCFSLSVSFCHHYSVLHVKIICIIEKTTNSIIERLTWHAWVLQFVVLLTIHMEITAWNVNSQEIYTAKEIKRPMAVFPPKALHYSRDSLQWVLVHSMKTPSHPW